jgi:hypothetical protein
MNSARGSIMLGDSVGSPRRPWRLFGATVAVVALMSASAAAQQGETTAEIEDGDSLYANCMDTRAGWIVCRGYVEGIADVMTIPGGSIAGYTACVPDYHISAGQLLDVAKQFLASHPEKRRLGAAELLAHALSDAFPCR